MGSGLYTVIFSSPVSRPLRPEVPGAVWHITSRGNERQDVFLDDEDRERFLSLLGKVAGDFDWRVHAYVLMGNHYHLMLETPEPTLSRGMRQLNGIYTQAFNGRHDRVGHLYQGRFKAILVEREAHLLELIRYVVLNPVRAGFVRSPREWKWSSFAATAALAPAPPWLDSEWTLEQFGAPRSKAIGRYREFVGAEAGGAYRPWESLDGQIYLGGKRFRQDVEESIPSRIRRGVPRTQLKPGRPTANEIAAAIEDVIGPFSATRGGRSKERRLFASLLKSEGLLTYTAMSEHLGIGPWAASRLARDGEALRRGSAEMAKQVAEVCRRLRDG